MPREAEEHGRSENVIRIDPALEHGKSARRIENRRRTVGEIVYRYRACIGSQEFKVRTGETARPAHHERDLSPAHGALGHRQSEGTRVRP